MHTTLRTLCSVPLLACALTAHAAPTLDDFSTAAHRDWLTLSGVSHHFQPERRDWRESNPGIGLEREFTGTPWVASAGYFRFGAFGLLATGYPSPILILPAVSAQVGRVGANLIALPNLPGYSGYLGLQIRLALD